jgi:hypothetical protein
MTQMLRLPRIEKPDSSMWVDEAMWGHRLHDEQSPALTYLEFVNIFCYEAEAGRGFSEVSYNSLRYRPAKRLQLRNILFNNPKLDEIRKQNTPDDHKWKTWFTVMSETKVGTYDANFDYLRRHFNSFDDFCDICSIIRSTSFELKSNKRWTSKFVFPYGANCLYEDLDHNAATNDRRFFGRTGELLYLMLCRSEKRNELLDLLQTKIIQTDSIWNMLVKCLQPDSQEDDGSLRGGSYLPYKRHITFDQLAEDWIAILKLSMPGFDAIPHLINLIGLHILRYQLLISHQIAQSPMPLRLICEIVAPKKTLVRELSCDNYQCNNELSQQAINAYIAEIVSSQEWKEAIAGHGAFLACREILDTQVYWPGEDYDGNNDPETLIAELKAAAIKRHRQHVANVHRNYGRDIGLISKRGTVKLRYAPNDSLLKTLIYANVQERMELHQFLARVFTRYSIVLGDKEAEQVLTAEEYEKKAFQANARRLEQRLTSLGLIKRLSDGCAYVINPYQGSVDGSQ